MANIVRVWLLDFWKGFDPEGDFLMQALRHAGGPMEKPEILAENAAKIRAVLDQA